LSRTRLALILGVFIGFAMGCDSRPSIEEVRVLQAQARFEESLEPLRQLLELSPEDPEINYRYGAALNRTTASPVASWSLRKAAESETWAVRANIELAATSYRSGDRKGAIQSATTALELDPDLIEALRIRGSALMADGGDPALAREDFEAILEISPNDIGASTSLAAALLALGEVDEAAALLKRIDESAQDSEAVEATQAVLCATRATLQAERGELEIAEVELSSCIERFPTNSIVIQQAIAFFDQTGRPERATKILTGALAASPGNSGFRESLSNRTQIAGDYEKAEAILREATTLSHPRIRSQAFIALTNFYIDRDDLSAAADAYEQAMALADRPSELAMLTFADLLARGERHEEALKVAAGLDRDDYRGLIEARIHLNEHRPAEALERLDGILVSWPNNAGARYYAARSAEQLGDFARAIEEYRQSIRSDSKLTESGLRLAKTYLAAGSLQNAWNTAAQYFRLHREDSDAVRVLLRTASIADPKSVNLLFKQLSGSSQWPIAVSVRAEFVESREGAGAALVMLTTAGEVDLTLPANAELLRTQVRLQLKVGQSDAAQTACAAALAANPDFGLFHEIHGLVLEHAGAGASDIRAAYSRAVALAPNNWIVLDSMGRLEQSQDNLKAALDYYRRAVEAAPQAESPGRSAARALQNAGRLAEAEQAWEAQLTEHPWDSQAALALAGLRIRAGNTDDRTLELAERAVLFSGGGDAQTQLIALHKSRGENERAHALSQAIEKGQPLAPMRITPIDRL